MIRNGKVRNTKTNSVNMHTENKIKIITENYFTLKYHEKLF